MKGKHVCHECAVKCALICPLHEFGSDLRESGAHLGLVAALLARPVHAEGADADVASPEVRA